MSNIKEVIIIFLVSLMIIQSVSAISNVQHSVDSNKVTLTYQGTPPFLINIRPDTNVGQKGGYLWAKTYSSSFSYDMSFAINPSKKFYYGVKDTSWSSVASFSLGTIDKLSVLNMLNGCHVNSQLTSKQYNPSFNGNTQCGDSGKCVATYLSEVPNPQDPDFTLQNTLRTTCSDQYNGHTNSYYIQSVCCS